MPMERLLAQLLAGILTVLALLHLPWLLGARRGLAAVVPTVRGKAAFTPGPVATLLVILGLLAAAGIVLWRAGWVSFPGPAWIPRVGIWGLAVVFAARAVGDFRLVGFFKTVRGTRFARLDDRVFSPLCVLIAGLAAWIGILG